MLLEDAGLLAEMRDRGVPVAALADGELEVIGGAAGAVMVIAVAAAITRVRIRACVIVFSVSSAPRVGVVALSYFFSVPRSIAAVVIAE